jgi:hypothetical protein
MPKVIVTCQVCGKERELPPSSVKRGEGKFCSKTCAGVAKTRSHTVEVTCDTCGKVFVNANCFVVKYKTHYCSVRCQRAAQRKEALKTYVVVTCVNCGLTINIQQSQVKWGMGKYCSNKCKREYWSKGHSPSYKDGRTSNPGYNASMKHRRRARKLAVGGSYTIKEWEELVERCGHKCLMCGRPDTEVKLTVDHILPISKGGSNCIENLQPLCRSCNSKKSTKTTRFLK